MADPEDVFAVGGVVNHFGSKVNAVRSRFNREDVADERPVLEIRRCVQVHGVIRSESAMAELEVDARTIFRRNNSGLELAIAVAHPVPIEKVVVAVTPSDDVAVVNVHEIAVHVSARLSVVDQRRRSDGDEEKEKHRMN